MACILVMGKNTLFKGQLMEGMRLTVLNIAGDAFSKGLDAVVDKMRCRIERKILKRDEA